MAAEDTDVQWVRPSTLGAPARERRLSRDRLLSHRNTDYIDKWPRPHGAPLLIHCAQACKFALRRELAMEEAALVPSLALQTSPPSIKVNPPGSLTGMQPPVARPTSSGARGSLAPSSFYCPISMELMGDPCMLATGHTYERVSTRPLATDISSAITLWHDRQYGCCHFCA